MNEAFLAALRDQPDDDTTRLIYADWLDDQGDLERSEFIRVQVRLGQMSRSDLERAALEARDRELTAAHGQRWLGDRADSLIEWGFRGGMVDRLVFNPSARLEEIEPLLTRHPVTDLVLNSRALLRPLSRSPALGLIRGLTLNTSLFRSAPELHPLLDSPHLRGLRSLALSSTGVDNHLARALAAARGLAGLRTLRLRNTILSDAGVVKLLEPGVFPELREWDVDCPNASWLGLENLFAVHRAPNWTTLSYPDLRTYRMRRLLRYLPELGKIGRCINLRRLSVHVPYGLAYEMGGTLGWLGPLKQLRELHLSGEVAGLVEKLAAWPGLAQLERLSLQIPASLRSQVRETLASSEYHNPGTVVTVS
jgi:uncharacterized protein (TIGR02996 family)